MNYNHFGVLLKEIREMNNMTLEQLSEDICSIRQLSRIESGENNPSLYVLHNISKKLNIDLQEYYRIHFCSGSFIAYDYKSKFEQLIANSDVIGLKKLIEKIEIMEEFQYGENKQYILYGKALCSSYLDNNYSMSNSYCIEGLLIEEPAFSLDMIENKLYSNVGLTMINLLASNYNKMRETDISFNIFENLFLVLENHIFYTPFAMYRSLDFEKKIYQTVSCNLSILNMNKTKYDKSLEYINKGISLSKKENYMRFLPELLAQKSRLLYKMGNHNESYQLFKDCLSFYRICRSDSETKKIKDEIESIFADINLSKTANQEP